MTASPFPPEASRQSSNPILTRGWTSAPKHRDHRLAQETTRCQTSRDRLTRKCVQSLIVIHAIRAACMQVIPLHSSAPAPHRFIFFASFGSCSIKLSNQDVRRHFLQDLFRACTGFKVHIAPPERRLYAPRQPQSPMLSQHVADLGVHAAFDPVRSRRNRSSLEQAFVEIGE